MKTVDLETHFVTQDWVDAMYANPEYPRFVEDPATGAAAAALGGYLRDSGLLAAPATILIRQGEAMGRPSRLWVEIPPTGGIMVTGAAVPIGTGIA